MKTLSMSAALVVCSAAMAAAQAAPPLGVPAARAREAVNSIVTDGVHNPYLPAAAKAFKAMTPAQRAQAATLGVAWLKGYVASPDFKKAYADLRQERKPEPTTYDKTPEEEVKAKHADAASASGDMKKFLDSLPADQRKQMEEAMKQAQAAVAQLNTPEMLKAEADNIRAEREQRKKDDADALARWQRDYPEDPRPLVIKRLQEFLAQTANVDFDAKVEGPANGQRFVDPKYQSKDEDWKLAYRAGREATTAARAAVQTWLKELGA